MSWSVVTLGDICELKYGKSLSAKVRRDGKVAVYGSNGKVGTHDVPFLTGPTIIIGRKGSVGEVHYCDGPNWPIDTTYYVDQSATECDLRWLTHVLKSSRIRDLNKAAAIPGLNRNDAYQEPVLLPPLHEQKRIAAILDKADQLRQKRRQAIALLDSLTQSIFLEMFGDPVSNPKQLPLVPLADLIDAADRLNYGVVQPGDTVEGGIPLIRISDLAMGRVDRSALKHIDPSISKKHSKSVLKGSEILISCVGSIGEIALASEADRGSNVARAVARVPLKKGISQEFVAAYLRTDIVQSYFTRELRTVSQPTLNIKQISETLIPLAGEEETREFERRLDFQRRLQRNQQMQLDGSETLFASLQHRAFTGQL